MSHHASFGQDQLKHMLIPAGAEREREILHIAFEKGGKHYGNITDE